MKEQLKLFATPVKKKKLWPFMFHLIIEEPDNEYHIWQGGFSEAQARKIAAKKYNRKMGFSNEHFVKFKEEYERKKRR